MRLRHSPSPEERNLTHFFYTEWPDCGVPRDPADLTDFTEIVRVHLNRTPRYGPTAVHCSAGVGRTGCFLALLQLLQRLRLCRAEACLDVQSVVCRLRRHRHRLMVQTLVRLTTRPRHWGSQETSHCHKMYYTSVDW
ncbi:PTN1 phosphatase, partial [Amia calva]|nr:PTN1 phosphatase [Amia calva]